MQNVEKSAVVDFIWWMSLWTIILI